MERENWKTPSLIAEKQIKKLAKASSDEDNATPREMKLGVFQSKNNTLNFDNENSLVHVSQVKANKPVTTSEVNTNNIKSNTH